MNSFELNKVLGAILGTCLILLAINIGAHAIFEPEKPAKPGYMIAVAKTEGGQQAAKKEETPLPVLLAKADAKKGERIAKQCAACHTFGKGEPNKVGPNLYNIVGDERGKDRGGFNFSSAMKSKGGEWTYEELFKFIHDPRGYIPGTAMTFAGIKNPEQIADVIAYLRSLSDNPKPLPKAEAAAKPAEAPKDAPKEGPKEAPKEAPKAAPERK